MYTPRQESCKGVKSRRCSHNVACSALETEMSSGGWNILNIATMSADGYSTSCLVCMLPGQKLNFVAEGQHQGEAEHPSAPHRKLILCSSETLHSMDLNGIESPWFHGTVHWNTCIYNLIIYIQYTYTLHTHVSIFICTYIYISFIIIHNKYVCMYSFMLPAGTCTAHYTGCPLCADGPSIYFFSPLCALTSGFV